MGPYKDPYGPQPGPGPNPDWARNLRNSTKSLVSGIWFLSPEAGGTAGRDPGEPWRATVDHSL